MGESRVCAHASLKSARVYTACARSFKLEVLLRLGVRCTNYREMLLGSVWLCVCVKNMGTEFGTSMVWVIRKDSFSENFCSRVYFHESFDYIIDVTSRLKVII